MYKITVREGETLQVPVTIDDSSAVSADFVVWDEDRNIVIELNEPFVNNKLTFDGGVIDLPVGMYSYGMSIYYSDGVIDELPDPSNCNGDCVFPEFEVCEGIPRES